MAVGRDPVAEPAVYYYNAGTRGWGWICEKKEKGKKHRHGIDGPCTIGVAILGMCRRWEA